MALSVRSLNQAKRNRIERRSYVDLAQSLLLIECCCAADDVDLKASGFDCPEQVWTRCGGREQSFFDPRIVLHYGSASSADALDGEDVDPVELGDDLLE